MGGVFRVDVLQTIGISLALVSGGAALLDRGVPRFRRIWPFVGIGLAVAVGLLTPLMRVWVPGPVPAPLAAYVAHWTPAPGALPAGFFPLFPWLSYVLAGSVVGLGWGTRARSGVAGPTVMRWAAGGVVLAVCSCELLPPVFALLERAPGLVQAFRAAYRVGLGLIAGGLCFGISRLPLVASSLRLLGRASLVLYWVHLELVYGPPGGALVRSLTVGSWSGWAAALTAAMLGLAAVLAFMRRKPGKHAEFEQRALVAPSLRGSPHQAL